jgi:hypothetical protein
MQWSGKVQNISRGGLCLVIGRRFELGTLLAIDVQGRVGDLPSRSLLARVVHVAVSPGGSWMLGCSFTNELTDEELKILL